MPVGRKPTNNRRLDAGKLVADQIAPTVAILVALDLLAAHLLICWAAKESLWAGADWPMALGCADRIAAADHRPSTGILTFKQPRLATHTGVLLATVNVCPAAGFLHAEAILTSVQERTLGGILTLGKAGATHTDLVVQTLTG